MRIEVHSDASAAPRVSATRRPDMIAGLRSCDRPRGRPPLRANASAPRLMRVLGDGVRQITERVGQRRPDHRVNFNSHEAIQPLLLRLRSDFSCCYHPTDLPARERLCSSLSMPRGMLRAVSGEPASPL